jgi:hypothetical protein
VLLREPGEHPSAARGAEVCGELAVERGVPLTRLQAEGSSGVARLASLIATGDFASAYLALLQGTDPSPAHAVDELKGRTSR